MAAAHWDAVYSGSQPEAVSWYQPSPVMSLRMLGALGVTKGQSIVDVGGGAGSLAATLVDSGYRDVTMLDVSAEALALARQRCRSAPVEFVHADVLDWRPERRYDAWHDRAVFHFLAAAEQRDRYVATLRNALPLGGGVVIGVFAPEAPPTCSGLPVARYDHSCLTSALGGGWNVIAEAREEHVTPRGDRQPFTWLTLRRVS